MKESKIYVFIKAVCMVLTLLLLLCLFCSCSANKTETVYLHKDWMYNPAMPSHFPYIAALQDYVFVGQIVSDPIDVKLGSDENYEIFTQYNVRVLMNIRGTLVYNTDIPVLKDGGYDKSKDYYVLSENDCLPEKGEICIIAASNMTDGSYRLSTCGFTSFTAIGISEDYYTGKNLSNGVLINEKSEISHGELSISASDKISNLSDIEDGILVSESMLNNPGSDEICELLMKSTLVKLWSQAVSEKYAVECRRERIMDSPYGTPGSPSFDETYMEYPDSALNN